MTNVKPATDEEIAAMPDRFAAPAEWGGGVTVDEAFSLLARIDADREEIANSRKLSDLDLQVAMEKLREKYAEIATLKAEVERFSRPCHLCFGDGSLYGGRPVSKTECPACHGTGRAR